MLLLSSLAKDQETSGRILLIAGRASADTGRQGLVWRHRRRALLAAVSTLRWPTQQAALWGFFNKKCSGIIQVISVDSCQSCYFQDPEGAVNTVREYFGLERTRYLKTCLSSAECSKGPMATKFPQFWKHCRSSKNLCFQVQRLQTILPGF